MEQIIFIGILVVIAGYMAWMLRYSPTARDTHELHQLNKITSPFAMQHVTPEETLEKLEAREWLYHESKAEWFKAICRIIIEKEAEYDKRTP